MNRSPILALTALALAACNAGSEDGASPRENASTLASASTTTTVYNYGTLAHPGSCLDAYGAGTGDGTQLDEWACNGTVAQAFSVVDLGNGTVNIVNPNSNKCLDVYGAGTGNGNKIDLWDCNGTVAQTWVLQPAANGFINIVNPNSNKCLDVAGDNPANGTLVQLYQCNGTSAQLWNPAAVGTSTTSTGGGTTTGGGTGSSCNPNAWVYLGSNSNACDGNVGESCGWTTSNEGQGYTCQTVSWGTGCEPGGTVCPGGTGSSSGGGSSSGSTAGGLAGILSEAQFDAFFPNRNGFYTYQGFVAAAASFPSFATAGSGTANKQEVAAFLANVAHETGSLVYIDEIAQGPYCMAESGCGCGGGEYFGRGPLQISWNYNYCAAGSALGIDLVDNPDLVSTNATVAWQTAIWFWMTSTGATSTTCHSAIDNGTGFGETIQIINGGLECNGGNPADVQDRVNFYNQFCGTLGVSPGNNLGC